MPDGGDNLLAVPNRRRAQQQAERKRGLGPLPPTRYALALRRQAANRVRAGQGKPALPTMGPGSCKACGGWGVSGSNRTRCTVCGGTGG